MAAADFYFAINATFRYIYQRYGREGLHAYWRALAREYFAEVTERFNKGGLKAVEEYWREFFEAEPDGEVSVRREGSEVIIEVRQCPAIKHLKAHKRQIMDLYCQHCDVINREMAQAAGLEFHMSGTVGTCRQVFTKKKG